MENIKICILYVLFDFLLKIHIYVYLVFYVELVDLFRLRVAFRYKFKFQNVDTLLRFELCELVLISFQII